MQDLENSIYGREQGSSNALNLPLCVSVCTPARPSQDSWQKLSDVLIRVMPHHFEWSKKDE